MLSLEPRPCRELGRMWAAGELGELEQGEVLWGELVCLSGVSGEGRMKDH